jgi:hypothetical protein
MYYCRGYKLVYFKIKQDYYGIKFNKEKGKKATKLAQSDETQCDK